MKRTVAILLTLLLTIGILMPVTAVAQTEEDTFVIDTTPQKIEVMVRDADGNLVENEGKQLHELNLAFQVLCARLLSKKTLFNQQDMIPDDPDEYKRTTYIYSHRDLSVEEAAQLGFDDAVDVPPEGDTTTSVVYTMFESRLYFIKDNGDIQERYIQRLRRTKSTYTIRDDGTRSAVYDYKYSIDNVTVSTIPASSVTLSADGKTVTKVGTTNTRALNVLLSQEDWSSGIYGGAESGDTPDVYVGTRTGWGFFHPSTVPGVDTVWKGTMSYGGTGCYVDLGAYYVITDAVIFGATGTLKYDFQIGDPGNWVTLFTTTGSAGNAYAANFENLPQQDFEVPREYAYQYNNDVRYKNATRYVRIDENGNNSCEAALYGYKVGELTEYDAGKNGPSYYMEYNENNFSHYDPQESGYEKGILASKLDTTNVNTYDPHGYLTYVEANRIDGTADITVGDGFGANGIFTNKIENMKNLGNFREFVSTYSLLDQDGHNRYQYFGSQNRDNMDDLYSKLFNMGIQVNPCLQLSSVFFSGAHLYTGYDQTRNWCPLEVEVISKTNSNNREVATDAVKASGIDSSRAVAFTRHASYMYNYAARYGTNTNVDTSTLNLAKNIVQSNAVVDEEAKVGIGYVRVMENGNEQNKNWAGQMSYYDAASYAALCSADFDGHEQTLYMDTDGNCYEMFTDGTHTYLSLEGVTVGIMNGYTLQLLDSVSLVEVDTYTDKYYNVIEVDTDNKAFINGMQIGIFAPNEDGQTGLLTRFETFSKETEFELNNRQKTLKLQRDGVRVGNFSPENLTVADAQGNRIGVAYDWYIQFNHKEYASLNYYVDPSTDVAYYEWAPVGSLNDAENAITLTQAKLGTTARTTMPARYASEATVTGAEVAVEKQTDVVYGDLVASIANASAQGQTLSIKVQIQPTGVKTADPNMKLATGGFLFDTLLQYLEQMKDWFDYNRKDGYFAVDVINYHYYCNDQSVEDDLESQQVMEQITQWVEQNVPGREIWISEFDTDSIDYSVVQSVQQAVYGENGEITGYETTADNVADLEFTFSGNDNSNLIYYATGEDGKQYKMTLWGGYCDRMDGKEVDWSNKYGAGFMAISVSQIDNSLYQLTKAQRLLRGTLILNQLGVDRQSMFEIYDSETGVYSNSGLTTFIGAESPKLSWYYYSTGRRVLEDFQLREVNVETANLALQETLLDEYTTTWSPSQPGSRGGDKTSGYMDYTKIHRRHFNAGTAGSEAIPIHTYRYDNAARNNGVANEVVYAIWAGSDVQNVIHDYELDISDSNLTDYHVTLITPAFGYETGITSGLTATNGKVKLDVSETIAFVKVTQNTYDENNKISNYDPLASSLIKPQMLQIGDVSLNKSTEQHDGTEIIPLYNGDTKHVLYSKSDLIKASDVMTTAESLELKATEAASTAAAAATQTMYQNAMTAALNANNQTSLQNVINYAEDVYDIAYNGLGGWRPWQIEAAQQLGDIMLDLANAVQSVLDGLPAMTVAQAIAAMDSLRPKYEACLTHIDLCIEKSVSRVLSSANNVINNLRKTPIFIVSETYYGITNISALTASMSNTLDVVQAAISSNNAAQLASASEQALALSQTLSDYGDRYAAVMKESFLALGESDNNLNILVSRLKTMAENLVKSLKFATNAMGTSDSFTIYANVAAGIYQNEQVANSPLDSVNSLPSMQAKADESVSTNGLKLINEGARALYAANASMLFSLYGVYASVQQRSGIYYDAQAQMVQAPVGSIIVSDYLLSQFAKLFDEPVTNFPTFAMDLQRRYNPDGVFGTTWTQAPQSTTNLMRNYISEYGEEGYDLLLTLDDYYILDAANLYVNAGNTRLDIYDASEGGSGALLFTYENTSSLTGWVRLFDDDRIPGVATRYFTDAAKTTPTNKLRLVWRNGGATLGELAMYGRKANSMAGLDVAPVPGEVETNRVRKASVNFNPQMAGVTTPASITGMPLDANTGVTTLAANNRTLPTFDTVQQTDASGLLHIYSFSGWYTNAACTAGNEFTINTPISNTLTVYGKWIELPPYDQIIVSESMLSTTDKTYYGTLLPRVFDQQDVEPGTIAGVWSNNSFHAPSDIMVDLGESYVLEQVKILNGTGPNNMTLSVSADGVNYTPLETFTMVSNQKEQNFYYASDYTGETPITARYLKFTADGNLIEIYLYGYLPSAGNTVNFDLNIPDTMSAQQAGTAPEALSLSEGQTYRLPAHVSAADNASHVFMGWATSPDAGAEALLSLSEDYTAGASGVTYYGVWSPARRLVLSGASIRIASPAALRYIAVDNFYTQARGFDEVKYGILMLPNDLLGQAGALDIQTPNILNVTVLNKAFVTDVAQITMKVADQGVAANAYNGCLTNIPQGSYDRNIVAGIYVQYVRDGQPATDYATDIHGSDGLCIRSIYSTARNIIAAQAPDVVAQYEQIYGTEASVELFKRYFGKYFIQ